MAAGLFCVNGVFAIKMRFGGAYACNVCDYVFDGQTDVDGPLLAAHARVCINIERYHYINGCVCVVACPCFMDLMCRIFER